MFAIAQVAMAGRQTFSTLTAMTKDLQLPLFRLASISLADILKLRGLVMVSRYYTSHLGMYRSAILNTKF